MDIAIVRDRARTEGCEIRASFIDRFPIGKGGVKVEVGPDSIRKLIVEVKPRWASRGVLAFLRLVHVGEDLKI